MPQRKNLKPALADTLRQLRNDVQAGATVAHGVKTVEPGEGLQLIAPTGVEDPDIFWGWETATTYRQRIEQATEDVAQAAARLEVQEAELADAQDRIGRVKAGEIDEIDGHIIINGTVDLPALNVTGEMAGTIARFMDVTARRGLFTEGLTAQDSTLLGTTMAETINAGAIATRIMTSGLLQTSTDASRGVKIDNSGVRAWDNDGRQTVNLDGRSNYITGAFATAEKEQRVEIKSGGSIASADFYGSGQTIDHLGVWHQSDLGQNTVSKIISFNQIAQVKGNPGMLLYPLRGEFAFAGRWAQESDTVKFLRMDNSGGLAAGQYADITYTYIFPFTSQYTVLMPYLSVETETGRECVAIVMKMTFSTIKVRVVNKSGGDSGDLKVRGVVFNMNDHAYNQYW